MKKIKYNIITFPGSNCDLDIQWVSKLMGAECEFVWHKEKSLKKPDVVVIPGGFSYGDYLRCGALANLSNIMLELVRFANEGGLVIGICNGFQILTEAKLLPGALLKNQALKFICRHQYVKVENNETAFSCDFEKGEIVDIPIAHKDGLYFIDEDGLNSLMINNQIVFRYCDKDGNINDDSNPNGSLSNIAGIVNKKGNILGMMPHPERSTDSILPSNRGTGVFRSIHKWVYDRI